MSKTFSERLMYVQFMYCVLGTTKRIRGDAPVIITQCFWVTFVVVLKMYCTLQRFHDKS